MTKDTIIEREMEVFEDKCFQMTDKGGFIIRYESGFVGIATGTQADWLRQALTRAYEAGRKEMHREVLEVLYVHGEHDDERSVCDADGLYCRSECVAAAAKRIEALSTPPTPEELMSPLPPNE